MHMCTERRLHRENFEVDSGEQLSSSSTDQSFMHEEGIQLDIASSSFWPGLSMKILVILPLSLSLWKIIMSIRLT